MAPPNAGPQGSTDPIRELLDSKTLADEITKAIEGNDCPREKDLLAYLRKELDEPERIEVKSHLAFCNRCQGRASQLELEPTSQAPPPQAEESPPASSLSTALRKRRKSRMKLLAAGAAVSILLIAMYAIAVHSGDFPYSIQILHDGSAPKGEQFCYEVRTPEPIYLIEITIEGNGQIASKIPPCGRDGVVSDLERIPLLPKVPGVLDLYVVPCPTSEGFPNRLLSEVLKFIRTENSLDRENQRRGIEMALRYYHLKFLHVLHRIDT